MRGPEQSGRETRGSGTSNNTAVVTLPRIEQGRGSEGNLSGTPLFIFFLLTASCLLSYIGELPKRSLNFL